MRPFPLMCVIVSSVVFGELASPLRSAGLLVTSNFELSSRWQHLQQHRARGSSDRFAVDDLVGPPSASHGLLDVTSVAASPPPSATTGMAPPAPKRKLPSSNLSLVIKDDHPLVGVTGTVITQTGIAVDRTALADGATLAEKGPSGPIALATTGPQGGTPPLPAPTVVATSRHGSAESMICRPRFPYVRSRTAFPEIAVQLKVQLQQHIATSGAQVAAPKVFRWVEIGSRRCLNTEQMLNMFRARMPTGWSIETYAVDSWGYRGPEAVADNNDNKRGQAHMAECRSAIGHLPGVHLVKNLSVSAASLFDDGFFDFVYIDALHTYEACAADMAAWYAKTKPGGLFSGDDFGDVMLPDEANLFKAGHIGRLFRWGVIRAVTEFAIRHSIDYHITAYETQYHEGFGPRGRPMQAAPNWYFVKPHPRWVHAACESVQWPRDQTLGPDGNTTERFVDAQVALANRRVKTRQRSYC